jgi:hypothetical protein
MASIGQHGSGHDCPTWKIVAIIIIAVLVFSPIVFKALGG